MIFRDRKHAGIELGRLLLKYKESKPVVVGLPRGGVVVAAEVAHALDAPLEIVVPRKIGSPENPEYALGAVTEDGEVFLDDQRVTLSFVSEHYIREEIEKQIHEAQRRVKLYRLGRIPISFRDRYVMLVDDGIATGSTMLVAIQYVRQQEPQKIIVAVPVIAFDSLQKMKQVADAVVAVYTPSLFSAVGEFYEDFPQTSDAEVVSILRKFSTSL
ncbi:MAG: hypothetical protein A3B74_03585 [Candidatus Kerfeldbacteria bacterium RIFCSPHIGHO2_02_FULL_42_14]|uniref:Phosphoribosyltransferase domain-containing protein n=1 Tax=Candidatus Kerfeldbacteria bacterium RIFCSPHIGHO2_02_FULL_42_14 TaxID=1798540 RepID=A0A1G2AR15_9BACT|nr:MAG: hypothetical protein A3B74_03585 [Candidatus Kerfeldbacteria bacterium RIFCSPHIGHO2_02_FULL_42_14]OGY80599.1 MAG: hypothetical protein A3E60_04080 [Candidatus Kerfeldbacteria bacterium RIFCSPHIGHO2_12_FULL_42_13]OGY82523.1 MAG: hypothetical protein A3I91_03745 [Candidatus Kerfeldbacteria bacterium RIFCSPLOWO2_02_FULL_42_19]OGY87555.1 MAG: hypothetical protein A3G01_00855 [Candidatus Kerfeldbacteria bacterium RIFCSPLOWO2_12_FULL_43_9]